MYSDLRCISAKCMEPWIYFNDKSFLLFFSLVVAEKSAQIGTIKPACSPGH